MQQYETVQSCVSWSFIFNPDVFKLISFLATTIAVVLQVILRREQEIEAPMPRPEACQSIITSENDQPVYLSDVMHVRMYLGCT